MARRSVRLAHRAWAGRSRRAPRQRQARRDATRNSRSLSQQDRIAVSQRTNELLLEIVGARAQVGRHALVIQLARTFDVRVQPLPQIACAPTLVHLDLVIPVSYTHLRAH